MWTFSKKCSFEAVVVVRVFIIAMSAVNVITMLIVNDERLYRSNEDNQKQQRSESHLLLFDRTSC